MKRWDLSHLHELTLRRKPEKPILQKNKPKETSFDVSHVLQRSDRKSTKEKPILRKQPSEKFDLRKIDKTLKKDNNSPSLSSSVQESKKKKARKAKESFAQRRKRLRLEQLKAEARSNFHREMPLPIKPFCNYSESDNEPSVYEAVMDERRAEGMGYGGAR